MWCPLPLPRKLPSRANATSQFFLHAAGEQEGSSDLFGIANG
jgi:hypothetical protein